MHSYTVFLVSVMLRRSQRKRIPSALVASTQAPSARKRATYEPIRTSSPGVASTVTTTVGTTQASTPLSGPRSTSYDSTTPLSGPMSTSYVSAGNYLVYQTCTVPTE